MTARQLVEVIEDNAFIAIEINGRITYSGSAGKAKETKWLCDLNQVKSVKIGRNEYSATIIIVE